ncbi:MAG TPA: response regulator [Bryobacteraceae bacterium]|jgi:two-component system response regulator FixJ|nr:response regulator [Bryobacteraceae bacterium]
MMEAAVEKTVVVVEDDEAMRTYLSEVLTSGGYGCRAFSNSADALAWLASGKLRVDLLLSDVKMPGMNGLDLLRTVKTVAPDLPFVLISGRSDFHIVRNAVLAGAAGYLLKPIPPAELLSLVKTHVRSAERPKPPSGL